MADPTKTTIVPTITDKTRVVMLLSAVVASEHSIKGDSTSKSILEAVRINIGLINNKLGYDAVAVGVYADAEGVGACLAVLRDRSLGFLQFTSHGATRDITGAELFYVHGATHRVLSKGRVTSYKDAVSHADMDVVVKAYNIKTEAKVDYMHCTRDWAKSWDGSVKNVLNYLKINESVYTKRE